MTNPILKHILIILLAIQLPLHLLSQDSLETPVYTNDYLGISVRIPGKIGFLTRRVANDLTTYYVKAFDTEQEVHYICLMENNAKGSDVMVDSVILKGYLKKIKGNPGINGLQFRPLSFEGYPGQLLKFSDSSSGTALHFSVMNILRGNRNYFFTLFSPLRKMVNKHEDRFLASLQFIEPDTTGWTDHLLPQNSLPVWAPAPFEKVENDTIGNIFEESSHFSYDSVTSTNLTISKFIFPRLFWYPSDTALLRARVAESIGEGERLLSFEFTHNGPFRSAEGWIGYTHSHMNRRVRLLVNGDTLIAMVTAADMRTLKSANIKKMFENYRPAATPAASTIFTNKSGQLFNDFESSDTTVLNEVIDIAELVTYTKEDLPWLYEGLKRNWSRADLFINNYYAGALVQVHHPSTLDTLKEMYRNAGSDMVKAEILFALAGWRTAEAHRILTDLLLKGIPANDRIYDVFEVFRDSSALAAPFAQQLLPLLKDSLARPFVIQLCGQLLEEKFMQPAALGAWKGFIYKHAAGIAAAKLDESTPYWYCMAMVKLLTYMMEPGAISSLNKFLSQPSTIIKLGAAAALIRNNQPVPAAVLQKIAADSITRIILYDTLTKLKKPALFPAKYLNQVAISESELLDYISDHSSEFSSINFLKEIITDFKGSKQKFILYKLVFDIEGFPQPFLGIAGPFPVRPSALPVTGSAATGVFLGRGYAIENIDDDLKEWLMQFEE
ncbi:hypothetical protein EV199_3156 [Pseudobacter ginsenosidimutans]|uniref:Uncharacterized protein n=1 Tax=Pseudobacter ginsenosidimutans TaxID=661488 RepID=A0A4Q7MTI2_9BACT|nr:hypothetical protein EV199_3156 [Pseudobacter ginsenosidimutans]